MKINQREGTAELFRNTFEQAAVGIAHVSPDGQWVRVNQKFCDIVGFSHNELIQLKFQDITHPDDLDGDLDLVRQLLSGKIQMYTKEKRYIRKNQSYVWINLTVSLVRDNVGHPRYFISVVEDISRRKQLEEELLRHQENLERVVAERTEKIRQLSLAVEQSPVSVVITDIGGLITYVNPKFSELTGYSYEDSIGANPRILKSPTTSRDVYTDLWATLTAGRLWRGEFCNQKKNGELYWESAAISPLLDDKGHITHYVAVKENITERKKLQEQLQELSLKDELTGLSNRRSFYLLAEQQIKEANRQQQEFLLFSADMDGLKTINDTWGHLAGDRAIIAIAGILRSTLRDSDIIARLGGDEYAGVSIKADAQDAPKMLERLQANLAAWNLASAEPYKLSVSIGVVEYDPQQPSSLEKLLAMADQRMYEEKKRKKK